MACINCNIDFDGEFCPSCGEKKDVDRITLTSIVQSSFSGFMDMDKGLLFNLKNLTLRPQKTILNYINGKRRQILNPISYAIITISVYLFLDSILPRTLMELQEVDVFGTQEMGMKIGYFMSSKMKFLWLSYAIYGAVFTKLFFKKYNFFEHLVINFFVLGHATIVAILIRLLYHNELLIFNFLVFTYISILLYKVFKNPKDTFGTGVLSVLSVLLGYLFFMGIPSIFVFLTQ